MKAKAYIYILILLTLNSLIAQISGIINTYTKVIDITKPCPKITVSDVSGFNINDKVLIIQMKGATVLTANNNTFGNITAYNNAGNYEFAEIRDIQGLDIHLKYELLRDYDPADLVQLVRIPQYADITVTGTLTAKAWDGNTGGVLVFEASGTVTLNADIDVSGLGFRGGLVNVNNSGTNPCSSNIVSTISTNILAAGKGESISQYILGSENGYGKQANGGGGGVSNNTGGGGGSNFAAGGIGGNQAVMPGSFGGCGLSGPGNKGIGGIALTYSNVTNKLFMGGGGGAGQQNNLHNGGHSTPGGNGGGIVLIKASSFAGQNFAIKSNGTLSTGPSPAQGDAGGGGGGSGVIAIDCNTFNTLNIEVKGGNGDSVSDGTGRDVGPGGGGGGGLFWTSAPALDTEISIDVSGGTAGISSVSNNNHGAIKGNDGGILTNLVIPESNVLGTGCTTPLQLIAFSAFLQKNNSVLLQWSTLREIDVAHYQLQRSVDGFSFETIYNVRPQQNAGIHHYTFNDLQAPEQELIYYRLVEVSPSHNLKNLSTVSIQNHNTNTWLTVTPNPFSTLLAIKTLRHIQDIKLMDVNGKILLSLGSFEENNNLELSTHTLPAGFYLLKVVHDGAIRYEKLLKQ